MKLFQTDYFYEKGGNLVQYLPSDSQNTFSDMKTEQPNENYSLLQTCLLYYSCKNKDFYC